MPNREHHSLDHSQFDSLWTAFLVGSHCSQAAMGWGLQSVFIGRVDLQSSSHGEIGLCI